jgi:hypothetical protein
MVKVEEKGFGWKLKTETPLQRGAFPGQIEKHGNFFNL